MLYGTKDFVGFQCFVSHLPSHHSTASRTGWLPLGGTDRGLGSTNLLPSRFRGKGISSFRKPGFVQDLVLHCPGTFVWEAVKAGFIDGFCDCASPDHVQPTGLPELRGQAGGFV